MCLFFSDHATSSVKLVSFNMVNKSTVSTWTSKDFAFLRWKWTSKYLNIQTAIICWQLHSTGPPPHCVQWFIFSLWCLIFFLFFFVMLILKVSLQRSVTAVSHKETIKRDYLNLQKFLSRICGYFFTKFFLLLLLNDSLFKREKKRLRLFFQVAAWHLLFVLCKINLIFSLFYMLVCDFY